MGGVVVAVARPVVSICEDCQIVLRVGRGDLGPRADVMERLFACVQSEIGRLFLDAAHALSTRVTIATVVVDLPVTLFFVLVLAVAAVALGVVGFGLARATTVLALFDRTTLGIDMMKFAISMIAATHAVTFDAGLAGILLAFDDRHTV